LSVLFSDIFNDFKSDSFFQEVIIKTYSPYFYPCNMFMRHQQMLCYFMRLFLVHRSYYEDRLKSSCSHLTTPFKFPRSGWSVV